MQPDVYYFLPPFLTHNSSIFCLCWPEGRAGGIPNFKCSWVWGTLPSHTAILSTHETGLCWVPILLPLVSSLNSPSHQDLHILTNPSRLEISICFLPTLWKTRPKTNISSVHGCCGMSKKGWRAKSLPHPTPMGKVVWKECSLSSVWEGVLCSRVHQCHALSFSLIYQAGFGPVTTSSSKQFLLSVSVVLPTLMTALFCLPNLKYQDT